MVGMRHPMVGSEMVAYAAHHGQGEAALSWGVGLIWQRCCGIWRSASCDNRGGCSWVDGVVGSPLR